jgi:hypothetical protein
VGANKDITVMTMLAKFIEKDVIVARLGVESIYRPLHIAPHRNVAA